MTNTPYDIAWCPGCGNFAIRGALEEALSDLPSHRSRSS